LRVAPDEYLAHERLARLRGLAEHRIVRRHRAPAEHDLAFRLHDLLELFFDATTQRRIARQEDDAAAVRARFGKLEAELLRRGGQELVRHLQQHARAVAGIRFGAAGTAVIEVREDLQALLQDLVRFAPLRIDHEADAASVVLVSRVIEALLFGPGRPRGAPPFGFSRAHKWPTALITKCIRPPSFRWRMRDFKG